MISSCVCVCNTVRTGGRWKCGPNFVGFCLVFAKTGLVVVLVLIKVGYVKQRNSLSVPSCEVTCVTVGL